MQTHLRHSIGDDISRSENVDLLTAFNIYLNNGRYIAQTIIFYLEIHCPLK